MDQINKKYVNFQSFLRSLNLEDNQYIKDIEQVNCIIFITKLRQELDKHEGETEKEKVDNAFKKLAITMKLNVTDYKDEDITKFKRYLLYFYLTSKQIL